MTEELEIAAPTDADLVRLATGDQDSPAGKQAASQLLARYQDRVYAWCLKHLRNRERALDITQEVLLSAYRNLDSFGGRSRFSSWLFAIARNRCISELRRPNLLVEKEIDVDELMSQTRDPDQILLDKLGEHKILDLIKKSLAPREQEVLWLRCYERMPIEMITRALKIEHASGARGILQTARRRLKAALHEHRTVEMETAP